MFRKFDQPTDAMHHSSTMEIVETDIFYKDESFVFQSVVFYSKSKNLIIEKRDVTDKKGKSRLEINLRDMQSSQKSWLHQETTDALDDSIGGVEAENVILNDRIKELEEDLIPTPLFSIPLAKPVPSTPIAKLKGSSNLLTYCRGYLDKNINKIMELITESWETTKNISSFRTRAHALHEHLQVDLKNEERFYLETIIPFGNHVINISYLRRRQEDLPSPNWIKQLKACWKEKVKNLHLIVGSCEQAILAK